jgi:carbamoyl-phosphate synthase large subunit
MNGTGTRPPVIVTGLHAADNPSPGLAVARCLVAGGRDVIGLCYSAVETGAHAADVFRQVYRMPRPEHDLDDYFERLAVIRAESGAEIVLPTLDPEVSLYARQQETLRRIGLQFLLPSQETLRRVEKEHLAAVGRGCGFHVPTLHPVRSIAQARATARRLGLPLMIKGAWYEAHRIDYLDEIPAAFRTLSQRWGLPVLLQAVVEGVEAVVACLCDGTGNMVRSLGLRKLGMSSQGTTWCGVTFRNRQLEAACARLLCELAWQGPCEVEVKLHERSGMLTLIELNTRFPSWIGAMVEVGRNLPLDLVHLAEGRQLQPDTGYTTGYVMARQHVDRIVPLSRMVALDTGGRVDA